MTNSEVAKNILLNHVCAKCIYQIYFKKKEGMPEDNFACGCNEREEEERFDSIPFIGERFINATMAILDKNGTCEYFSPKATLFGTFK